MASTNLGNVWFGVLIVLVLDVLWVTAFQFWYSAKTPDEFPFNFPPAVSLLGSFQFVYVGPLILYFMYRSHFKTVVGCIIGSAVGGLFTAVFMIFNNF